MIMIIRVLLATGMLMLCINSIGQGVQDFREGKHGWFMVDFTFAMMFLVIAIGLVFSEG